MHKAFITKESRKMELSMNNDLVPAAGEVLLDINAVGICGSDHHIYLGEHPYATYPLIQGHEFCGTIVQYGEDCKAQLPLGTQVVVEPLISCGTCYACSVGRYNCCENLKIVGVHVPGAFQEKVIVPENLLHPVPDLPSHIAVFAEPLSIAVQAVKRGGVTQSDKVLILGAGPIGQALVLACKDLNAQVSISDLVPSRLEKAKLMGADFTFQAGKDNPDDLINFSEGGYTVVIDAVGVEPAIQLGIQAIRAAGRFVLVGISGNNLPIPISTIIRKEIDVIGSRNSAHVFPEAISLLYKNQTKIEKLIYFSESIDTLPEMMEYSIKYPDLIEKVVVKIKSDF